jgi:hypothetical protein
MFAVPHSRRSGVAQFTTPSGRPLCRNRRFRGQFDDAQEETNATMMFCRQLCRVARRDLHVATRHLRATPCSFGKVNFSSVPPRPYSVSGHGGTPPNHSKIDDDALSKMDIDEMEAISKSWFGDHSTWDHEKLLSLMLCKSRDDETLKVLTDPCRRTSYSPA